MHRPTIEHVPHQATRALALSRQIWRKRAFLLGVCLLIACITIAVLSAKLANERMQHNIHMMEVHGEGMLYDGF